MGAFEKVIHKIGNWGTVMGAVFMLAIALLVTFTVIGRAFHIAFPGTFDLVETMMVVSIAFALVFGQLQDRHLRTELTMERIKGRLKSGLESFLGVLSLFYWVVLLYTGIELGIDRYIGGEADGTPRSARHPIPRGMDFCPHTDGHTPCFEAYQSC